MKYRFISDSHTHSECSFDGTDSVIMLCEQASALEMYSLTITDHCECNEYFKNNVKDDISRSIMQISKARAMYHDRLHVFTGIELGQPTQDSAAAEDALSLTDYDYILGSLHNLRGEKDFYFLEYTEENVYSLLDRYYDELLELAQQNLFDCMSHLDYPLRYIIGNSGLKVDISKYSERLDAVLETIIENNRSIEINTSGLRQIIRRTLPDINVLRRYKELGGKYVTLGSDAHRWGDVASGIETGLDMMLECGYTHFTVYDNHNPRLLPIL